MPSHIVAYVALLAFVATGSSARHSAQDAKAPAPVAASTLMPDGNQWTTTNLNVAADPSYCYDDVEAHCRRYGRLYTWESALRACRSLGDGWRLPTNADWQRLAKHYGGVRDDADDGGKAAYSALLIGGRAGFNVVMGGGRDAEGKYARLDAHGFFWTATESAQTTAWFYNFGRGGLILNRHGDGLKAMALSVRCISERRREPNLPGSSIAAWR
jgi:uncharacterized protein (TIGR02145 family)